MYFQGGKKPMSKSVFVEKLAKRLAMRAKVKVSKAHQDRASAIVENGAYDEYVKQFKKPTKSSKKED